MSLIYKALGDCPFANCTGTYQHALKLDIRPEYTDMSGWTTAAYQHGKTIEVGWACGDEIEFRCPSNVGLSELVHAINVIREKIYSPVIRSQEITIYGTLRRSFGPEMIEQILKFTGGGSVRASFDAVKPLEKKPELPEIPDGMEKLVSYRRFKLEQTGAALVMRIPLDEMAAKIKGGYLEVSSQRIESVPDYVLASSNRNQLWHVGLHVAACKRDPWSLAINGAHEAPHLDCKCGIYACDSLESLEAQGYNSLPVRAVVHQWGRIVRGDTGTIRSQYAEIVSIEVFENLLSGDDIDHVVDALREKYRVPVTINDSKREDSPEIKYASMTFTASTTALSRAVAASGIAVSDLAKKLAPLQKAYGARYGGHHDHVHVNSKHYTGDPAWDGAIQKKNELATYVALDRQQRNRRGKW